MEIELNFNVLVVFWFNSYDFCFLYEDSFICRIYYLRKYIIIKCYFEIRKFRYKFEIY